VRLFLRSIVDDPEATKMDGFSFGFMFALGIAVFALICWLLRLLFVGLYRLLKLMELEDLVWKLPLIAAGIGVLFLWKHLS
jgi:hypothetical protein